MTAAADDAWIQNSLARLETLEAQRGQLAAAGQTDKLAELDEELRSLYEVLESVAGDAPAAPANAMAPVAASIPQPGMPQPGIAQPAMPQPAMPQPAMPQPGIAQPGIAQPVMPQPGIAQPAMAQPGMPQPGMAQPGMAQPGMAQPGMAQPGMAQPGIEFSGEIDIKPPRSPLPFILAGVLVIGGGIGAVLAMGGESEEPKPEPTGPATVIKAGAVAEDTQEPVVAKGADADRTRGTNFKEGSNSGSSAPRRSSSGSRSRPNRSGNNKKDDGRKVTFGNSKDPLGGVN